MDSRNHNHEYRHPAPKLHLEWLANRSWCFYEYEPRQPQTLYLQWPAAQTQLGIALRGFRICFKPSARRTSIASNPKWTCWCPCCRSSLASLPELPLFTNYLNFQSQGKGPKNSHGAYPTSGMHSKGLLLCLRSERKSFILNAPPISPVSG